MRRSPSVRPSGSWTKRHIVPCPSLAKNVRALFAALKTEHSSLIHLCVHGELFGGSYPHPSVSSDPRVEPVQTGIYYSPTIQFCAFDLAIQCDQKERFFLDFKSARKHAEAAGFLFTEPLFIGPYQNAVDYSLGFDSTFPARLGLPSLGTPNKAAGIVVKLTASFLALPDGRRVRPILKRKIHKFSEDPKFQEAQKWTRAIGPMIQEERSALELLKQEVVLQATAARFKNAESKVGRIRDAKSQEAKETEALLREDLDDQLCRNQADIYQLLSPLVRQELNTFIEEVARRLF